MHGFVSEGAFISTANDYIGTSSRGSLEMFEAGLNVSSEITDRLRAGVQLFARDVGAFHDLPRIDWAFLQYQHRRWLGFRAGVVKMPFGLYNEYADIDAARVPILMPQGVYSVRNREALLAHRGFALYGTVPIARAGELDYQVWLGTLIIPDNAISISSNARLDGIDTRYVTGGQVFWHPPVDGLRLGGSYVRTSIDFRVTVDAATTAALLAAGIVPPGFDGSLVISQRPATLAIASAEYQRGRWMFAGEYARVYKRERSTIPVALPTRDSDGELFYGMATYQLTRCHALGAYYSVQHPDVDDRGGRDRTKFPERHFAFQRDLAATLRFDVNEHWLWKAEAHFIDGVADLTLDPLSDAKPARRWGLFLVRTTVTF
ncbi:MAG: hypothetical protein KIT31_14720 [Deltaproteobacteria bacterium]|nr:hypothetical protein [Deltaproteobacteria bacterium]